MFGTIRRHQKWLWIVISTVTIISFVAFFSPNRRRQQGWTGPRDYVGSINGRPVTKEEWRTLAVDARLTYGLYYGTWSEGDPASLNDFIRSRLLLTEKLKELNIKIPDSAVAQWIVTFFRDPNDKVFHKELYDRIVKTELPSHGLSEKDFENFARHEVGIQHLRTLAGTAGELVTPQEAEILFRRDNEEAQAEAVFFASSNYLAQVTVDPAAVGAFYTNNAGRYRIPERTVVTYVKFAASNYLAEADQELPKGTNLNQVIDRLYEQRGTNSFKDAANVPLAPDAAKAKLRDEIRERKATEVAEEKAIAFLNQLVEETEKDKTNTLERLAAAKGLEVGVTQPFAPAETPKGLQVPPSFSQTASKLTFEEPIADQPIPAEDGVYVIALKQRIPSEIQPLSSLGDRPAKDYQNYRAFELAQAAGRDLAAALTNGLAAGKTFDAIVTEKNSSPTVLAPFSRKSSTVVGLANPADASLVIRTTFSLSPGKASGFVMNVARNGGFVVYLKRIEPVPEAKLKAELPEYMKKLRESREREAFGEWFRKQMELARISLPGDKQRASAN